MNEFWNRASQDELAQLLPPSCAYPGDEALLHRVKQKRSREKRGVRIALRLAIAAAVVAALSFGTLAAYQRWHMPLDAPTYTGEALQVHETQSYSIPTDIGTDAQKLSDEWFIAQAMQALETVNKLDVDASRLRVTRQTNQTWSREEVLVTLTDEDGKTSDATFDAQSGYLIHITAFDKQLPTQGTPMSEEEALRIAQGYYDALPYARGYVYGLVEKYDDHAWSFQFEKSYELTLDGTTQTVPSAYEAVRIVIDPCTGAFQLSNCFYVPLLDDHQPGDVPLTQEQAGELAARAAALAQPVSAYTSTAELCCCLPQAPQTSDTEGKLAYSNVTRLGWAFRYDGELNGIADCYWVCVDLYTGEILSVDISG